jgi:hypothetical protein
VYIAIAALACLIWIPSFNAATQPKRNERLSVAFIGEGLDTKALQGALADQIPELSKQPIKQINVANADIDNFYMEQTLYSIADQSDFIILTEDNIRDDTISFYFDSVKKSEILVAFAPDAEYYLIDGAIAGIKIGGGDMNNNFMRFYSGEQQCYCFFGYKSESLKTLNGIGNENQDAALKALEWLLTEG